MSEYLNMVPSSRQKMATHGLQKENWHFIFFSGGVSFPLLLAELVELTLVDCFLSGVLVAASFCVVAGPGLDAGVDWSSECFLLPWNTYNMSWSYLSYPLCVCEFAFIIRFNKLKYALLHIFQSNQFPRHNVTTFYTCINDTHNSVHTTSTMLTQ